MKVAFLYADKVRERVMADAFVQGASRHGHDAVAASLSRAKDPEEFDVVAMFGVKSRERFLARRRAGASVVMIDKGYTRGGAGTGIKKWEYWRLSVNAHHPTERLLGDYPGDRWDHLNIRMSRWRKRGGHILLAGSSEKYHAFYGLTDPTIWAKKIIRRLQSYTNREIVYRPKPSWRDAVPIEGARYSKSGTIEDDLRGAWALITHGSNACFEAMVAGIPSIVLGNGVLKPISSTSIQDIESPRRASDEERRRLANGLAYHQYTAAEFASGKAWEVIAQEMHA